MRKSTVAAAAAGLLIVALPATASARTLKAFVGDPAFTQPKGVPDGTALNAFFPKSLKVHKGDSVKWENHSFHTVSILGKKATPPPVAQPDPAGGTYSGINAPDGSPFFYNGLGKFVYSAATFGAAGSKVVNDTTTHSSGAFAPTGTTPQNAKPGVYKLKFAKVGKYKVLCLIHPGMQQTVTVLKKKAKGADKPAAVETKVAKQSSALYKEAGKAAAEAVPENTVHVGAESKQATLLSMLPGARTVPRGTTITFINDSPSEVHNVVFTGPVQPDGSGTASAFAQQHAQATEPDGPGAPGGQVAPDFIYGSEPAANGIWTYSGNEFGNGFFWSPLMDDQPGEPPNGLLSSEKITFDTPGTFGYFCAIHGPSMSGTIKVI